MNGAWSYPGRFCRFRPECGEERPSATRSLFLAAESATRTGLDTRTAARYIPPTKLRKPPVLALVAGTAVFRLPPSAHPLDAQSGVKPGLGRLAESSPRQEVLRGQDGRQNEGLAE